MVLAGASVTDRGVGNGVEGWVTGSGWGGRVLICQQVQADYTHTVKHACVALFSRASCVCCVGYNHPLVVINLLRVSPSALVGLLQQVV